LGERGERATHQKQRGKAHDVKNVMRIVCASRGTVVPRKGQNVNRHRKNFEKKVMLSPVFGRAEKPRQRHGSSQDRGKKITGLHQ